MWEMLGALSGSSVDSKNAASLATSGSRCRQNRQNDRRSFALLVALPAIFSGHLRVVEVP